MTFARLVLRNLLYHWRGNLAVLLGVALGTAVLTGALLVGDSLRGSLRELTLARLGWVDEALLPGRFFRAALAAELPADKSAPAILLQGSAAAGNSRVGKVTILGVAPSFWPAGQLPVGKEFWQGTAAEVVLTRSLAERLGVRVGEPVTLSIVKVESIPRETLLGKRRAEDVLDPLDVTVRAILDDDGPAGFSLKPTPEPAYNAFVPLAFLQQRLDQPGRANAMLLAGAKPDLPTALHQQLTLEDWGLKVRTPRERAEAFYRLLAGRGAEADGLRKARWNGRVPPELAEAAAANDNVLSLDQVVKYYETRRNHLVLESQNLLLPPAVVEAAQRVAPWAEPVFVYLVDTLTDGKHDVPYVVMAGVNAKSMLGVDLADNEVALVQWPGSKLAAASGDTVRVLYYAPDETNRLVKHSAIFRVRAVPPLAGRLDDPDLTPEFPGITDKLDMSAWENPPFPYSPKRVRPADEEYWKRYRATPRAYVNLKTAQRLWGSRFGDVTSLHIENEPGRAELFMSALLRELAPERGGFVVQAVRQQALAASAGSNDFGMLFVGFSCFLIVSALLLVGLLFRLNIDRRAAELGVLLATGWTQRRARWLLLAEGVVLALLGGVVGLGGALAYAPLMLRLLRVNWPGGENLGFLRLHAEPASFAIGFVAALVVSVLTIVWATRMLGGLSPRALLAGETTSSAPAARGGWAWSQVLMPLGVIGALALIGVGATVTDHEARAGSFFGSGALMLTAALAAAWNGLRRLSREHAPQPSLGALGVRNASRHMVRSLLTIGLLAAATFVVVAVESFHKDADAAFLDPHGGSGGFALYGESAVPFYEDLNQPSVRDDLNLKDERLDKVHFVSCRVRSGDDTSCLNLYQPMKPRILGVPPELTTGERFAFASSLAESDEEKANPWRLLDRKFDDGALPAVLDATTAEYGLHVPLGGAIKVDDGQGRPVTLRVVGLLRESVFQSEVLVSEANFLRLYPRHEGFNFTLISTGDLDAAQVRHVESLLQDRLAGSGMTVAPTASRLQAYQAVENMYLATFQALGGLGLLLGAVGLAIVLLRGVWERRGELALLRALGFRSGRLAWLVLAENAFLLVLGLAAGTLSALLAVAPHLFGGEAQVLWVRIALLLLAVLAAGLVTGVIAVFASVRTPVLEALPRE